MGILSHIKEFAPWSLYLLGVAAFFTGLSGRVRWTLLLVALLLPLRNVVEKIQSLPAGTQFLDLLFISMILGWLFSSSDRKPLMGHSPINGAAIFVIIYTTFSMLYGSFALTGSPLIDPADPRVQDWKNFCLLPVLFFIARNNLPDQVWIRRLFYVMCFGMAMVAYYTSTQIAWFSSLESRSKISGTFQFLGPNEVAAFINQCTIIISGVFFFMKDKRIKILLLGLILINTYCIIFLYSRAAYIGLAAGLSVLFAFKKKILLVPLILVALLWQVVLPEKVIERIKETKNSYGELDESSERRIAMWEIGLQLFAGSPIIGIGYGVFRHLGLDLGDTHNIYVKIMVEQGAIGLLIFFIIVFCFIFEGFRLYQKGEDDLSRGLGLGFFACMFTLLVNNFFGDRWAYFELSAYIWIFAGIVSRLNEMAAQKPSQPVTPVTTVKTVEAPKRKRSSYYK